MKFDKSLLRTVLFSVSIVSFVIGTYQTLLQNDLARNYWLFMVSLCCWLPLRYWRQRENQAVKEAEVAATAVAEARRQASAPAPGKRKRR